MGKSMFSLRYVDADATGFTRVASYSEAHGLETSRTRSCTIIAANVPNVVPLPEYPVATYTFFETEFRPM